MTTKKRNIGLGVMVVVILSGLAFIFFFTKTITPSMIFVSECNVSNKLISIKGGFVDSANKYRGYKTTYSDHTLYVKIIGNIVPNITGSSGDFNISINNTFGDIQKIYLQGSDPSKKTLIWPSK